MRRLLLAACLAALLPASAPAEEPERNLVENGGFDAGDPGATLIPGWTEADGLTTFFEDLPGRGRVLRIDTDVNLSEANERWEEMDRRPGERPAAKPKGPTRPPKYDTVGGTTGAKIYSDYLRVEAGMRYRLRADVKSDAPTVMIFVKGYSQLEGGFRKFYQCYKNVAKPEPGWHTYERTFNPTLRTPRVSHIRIMPYAYWPPGQAWIDNVEVTRVGPEQTAGAATVKGLLENGDFESPAIAPWTAEGPVERVEADGEGACARVSAGGRLVSGRVPVSSDRPYVLRLRASPAGAVLSAEIEGLVRFGGSWVPLFTKKATAPPATEDWVEMEVAFHPTAETPQVTHARVVLTVLGESGSARVDDVTIEPAAEGRDE